MLLQFDNNHAGAIAAHNSFSRYLDVLIFY